VRLLVFIALVAAVTATARAQEARAPHRFALVIRGEVAGCPTESALRRAAAREIGGAPFDPEAERSITAHVRREERTLIGIVLVRDEEGVIVGTRETRVERPSCGALFRALAHAIAAVLDVGAAGDNGGSSTTTSTSTSTSTTEGDPPMPSPFAPAAPGQLRFLGGPGLVATIGVAPRMAIATTVGAGIEHDRLRILLGARFDLPVTDRDADGRTIRMRLYLGSLAACAESRGLHACAVGYAGTLRDDGLDESGRRNDRSLHVAAGVRAGYELRLGPVLRLVSHVELLGQTRPRLGTAGTILHRPRGFSFVYGLSLLLRAPRRARRVR
jgi:hypothetical protein